MEMLSALILAVLIGEGNGDSAANLQAAAPCSVIRKEATQYFTEHHFYTGSIAGTADAGISLGFSENALASSGAPLHLSRFSIHRYTLHRHLSPMKSYTTFRVTGQLTLTPVTPESCNASLHFDFTAYEYVWSLMAIDDGYRSQFTSNGTLEQDYLEALAAQLKTAEKVSQ